MAPASNVNIIDTKDEGIVVKETLISISDEKLKKLTVSYIRRSTKGYEQISFL